MIVAVAAVVAAVALVVVIVDWPPGSFRRRAEVKRGSEAE